MSYRLSDSYRGRRISWHWWAAASLFLCGFLGLLAGVELTERPDVVTSDWLTKAYYALGLFVFGGLDIGTPAGEPAWARGMLWLAYFGAPLLTASAVIEGALRVLAPHRWQLRRLEDHTIIFGSDRIAMSYLTILHRVSPGARVVVVDEDFDPVHEQELKAKFGAHTVVGDLTHDYLLEQLRLKRAARVLLLGTDAFQAFEAARRILDMAPHLKSKVILRCSNLRFMRALQDTKLARHCEVFNTYNLAAKGFVRDYLLDHFKQTRERDNVIVAGFGRFGQSVLEELHANAANEIEQVVLIDRDAARRVLVVDEQQTIHSDYRRTVFEGDISHPEVWQKLAEHIDLTRNSPTVVLGTGEEQNNLRTALWIRQRYPNALVFARTTEYSKFALEVGEDHDIRSISIAQLFEDNIPAHWVS